MASIVYQCKRCSNMLTDSNCIISEKDPLVFLSKIANSRVDEVICLSTEPFDCDCSYRQVFCGKCNEAIGRYYLATVPQLDYLRNHYSLCKDKLYEYRIQDVELEFQIQREKPDRAMSYFTGMDAERAAHFVKELRNLEMDILKLNERIDRLQ